MVWQDDPASPLSSDLANTALHPTAARIGNGRG